MKPNFFLRSLASVFCVLASVTTLCAAKPVMVYYMPWYVAKPCSTNWGWHWTMNHFNPDVINASGQRQIASWYYPLIGPYDSADPVVLEYHVLLMKLAGIDGVIVDWYGPDEYNDYAINNERTAALFQFTRKAGLKFSLCYEDQTVQQEINGGLFSASNAIAHAQGTMLYVQSNYFCDPSFLRLSNQPVLLNFGPQYFKGNGQWEAIFSVLSPTNQPAFFTEDNRVTPGWGAFDWPPMWLSQAPGTGGVLSVAALEGYLETFQKNGAFWPAYISSAFPRFHDIYSQAGVRNYWGYLGSRNGATLRETLARGMTNSSAIVQVVTWNDFGEGTVVEPTQEDGYRDLGIVQDNRRLFLDSNFPYHTNDLTLARRIYNLRRQYPSDPIVSEKLDSIFATITSGNLVEASNRIAAMDSQR